MIVDVHPDEFADIVMAYLFDMLRNKSDRPNNPRFDEFLDKMDGRGMRTLLYKEYLLFAADTRIKYNRMKSSSTNRIEISSGVTPYLREEFDRELFKKIFRKANEIRFKSCKVITEERLDKIIDYCLERQEEQQNG